MKKVVALLLAALLAVGVAGCGGLSDQDLLQKAFAKMETISSSRTEIIMDISAFGEITTVNYEIMAEKSGKSYMKVNMDFMGTGERNTFEMLVDGDQVRFRSDFLGDADEELREAAEASMAEGVEDPTKYEDMFLELADTTVFELIDNPANLDPKNFKTYRIILDGEALKEMTLEELDLGSGLLPEDEELDDEELEELNSFLTAMLDSISVEMVAEVVINVKTNLFHSMKLDMDMDFTFPDIFGDEDGLEQISVRYTVRIKYLEINSKLEFPELQ